MSLSVDWETGTMQLLLMDLLFLPKTRNIKNISLDFFGTDIIQSVGVNKAFNAGGSSDVGGATIDIVSKRTHW